MSFNTAERAYLEGQGLGRLVTIGPDGTPQVRPLGFRLNSDGTIDLGGPWVASTQRYRNVLANSRVAFIVDDMTPDDDPDAVKPGWGRGVEVRGRAETLELDEPPVAADFFGREVIRVHATRILSWHIDPDNPNGDARNVS